MDLTDKKRRILSRFKPYSATTMLKENNKRIFLRWIVKIVKRVESLID